MIDKLTDSFRNPIAMAVAVSVAVIAFILAVPSAIGVSYLVTANQIHHNTVQIEAVQKQTEEAAIKQQIAAAKATCVALVTLDNAHKGIKFEPSDSGNSARYLKNLISGIDGVVQASHCTDLLDGNYHVKDGQLVPGRA